MALSWDVMWGCPECMSEMRWGTLSEWLLDSDSEWELDFRPHSWVTTWVQQTETKMVRQMEQASDYRPRKSAKASELLSVA